MFDDLSTKTQACMAMGLFCVAVVWALYRIYSKDQDVDGRPVLRKLGPKETPGICNGIPPAETFQDVFGDSPTESSHNKLKWWRKEKTTSGDHALRHRKGITKKHSSPRSKTKTTMPKKEEACLSMKCVEDQKDLSTRH